MTPKDKSTDNARLQEQERIGERLRKLREEQGSSIEDVVEATRISASNVRALEAQDYEHLPADTFIRGYLLLYADLLDIDGQELVAAYFAERGQDRPPRRQRKNLSNPSLSPKKMAEPAHISSASVASLLLAVIVVGFTAFCLYHSWNPFAFLAEPTRDLQSAMINVFHGEGGEKTAAGEVSRPSTYLLTADFKKTSLVRITLDDLPPTQATYNAGDMASWTALKQLRVEFDQADAAELTANGSPLAFPPLVEGSATVHLPEQLPKQ